MFAQTSASVAMMSRNFDPVGQSSSSVIQLRKLAHLIKSDPRHKKIVYWIEALTKSKAYKIFSSIRRAISTISTASLPTSTPAARLLDGARAGI
jgi:hypothetical protein